MRYRKVLGRQTMAGTNRELAEELAKTSMFSAGEIERYLSRFGQAPTGRVRYLVRSAMDYASEHAVDLANVITVDGGGFSRAEFEVEE